jgi:hypothetical protein
MRTLTAAQTEIYNHDERQVNLKVSIKNTAGNWISLSTLEDRNWIESVRFGENLDQPVSQCSITLIRNDYYLSLAPLMAGSKINIDDPLVYIAREIRIETAVIPIDYTTVGADWVNVFEGRIDQVDWPEHRMTLQCRDRSGLLQDITIETETQRGADDLSKDAEDVMQDILNGADTGVTLSTPTPSSWAIKAYIQQKTQVLPAITLMADQIAWQVRQKWDAGTSTWKTTFFEPDRYKAIADKTFYLNQYYKINNISMNLAGIRNVIEITYTDGTSGLRQTLQYPENGNGTAGGNSTLTDSGKAWTVNAWTGYELWIVAGTGVGQHQTIASNTATQITIDTTWTTNPDNTSKYAIVHADDSAESIIKYGRRFCGIAEKATTQVDSAVRAFYMARRIYADISEPNAEQVIEMPYYHAVELGDLYTFVANGEHYDGDLTCAVVDFKHDLSGGRARTILTVRGKPSGGYRKWFAMEFRPGVAPAPRIDPPVTPTAPTVTTGLKSLTLAWAYTIDTYHPLDYFEIQYSTANATWDAGDLRYEVPSSPSWGAWADAPGGVCKTYDYLYPNADTTKVYRFKIRFRDTFGNLSEYSTATAPTAGTTEGIPQPVNVADTSAAVQVALTDTSIRHCVLECVLGEDNLPAFIQAAISGLNIDIAASSTYPFVCALSFGSSDNGTVDYVAKYSSNVESAWSGLPSNSQLFLYIDKATTVDGTITLGYAETPCQVGKEFDKTRNVLCHFTGASGSTNITDEYGNEVTVSGNARIGTGQSKFGGSALFCDGVDDYIDIDIPTLGNEPWAIEEWIRFSALPAPGSLVTIFGGLNQFSFVLYLSNTVLQFYASSNGTTMGIANQVSGVKSNFALNTWYKVALVWTGTQYIVHIGESGSATTADITVNSVDIIAPCGGIRLGADYNSANDFNGYIDEFRYTAGSYRRYGVAITPETVAFEPDAYWFDLNVWKTKKGGPTTGWTEYIRLFVGEAITNGSSVSTVTGYASGGTYDAGWFDVANSSTYDKTINLGTDPGLFQTQLRFRKNANYKLCDVTGMTMANTGLENGASVGIISRNQARVRTSNDYVSPYGATRIGATNIATATGQYRLIISRGY